MSITKKPRCFFHADKIGAASRSVRDAAAWVAGGWEVYYKDGIERKILSFGGTVENKRDIPTDAGYGVIFLCKSEKDWFISLPNELCEPGIGFMIFYDDDDDRTFTTYSLRDAAEAKRRGSSVYVFFGNKKGLLIDGGNIENSSFCPEKAEFGVMFYSKQEDRFILPMKPSAIIE